jgi:hypothetical protein
VIYNNSQNQTFSTSKTSPASNSQSYTQQHPEQQANSKTLASQNYPEQQTNGQTSASPQHKEQQANNQSPVQPPNNLTEAEYHELAVSSAIHPELIARNFIHIAGETVLNYLFISNAIPRLNTGRVTSSLLKLYQYATIGGIWISGLDPFNNWQRMEWGRFKPTQGRIDKNGKLVKYESPPKTPNRVTYFDVPDCIWDLVARRYNIKRYHSPLAQRLQDKLNPLSFWEWVLLHPEIPIILCEGEKKAACLLSQGFVAIALPGIWSGRIGKQDFDERLHPDIMPVAQPGRKFIILFDYETKPKTRWSIFQATLRTGKTIEAVGCSCEVALLPGPEKGVDDFVVERSKLIVRGQTVNDTQLIEQSRTSTLTQVINQTLPVKDHQATGNCQVVERYQVINQNSPVHNNQPLNINNGQVVENHQVLNQNSPVHNNQPLNINNGQVVENHQVLNQNSSVHNNQPLNINNGQVANHHQVLNHTLECKNNKLTENCQILEHHQGNNQILEGKNNLQTENCQILEHHQANNQKLPVPNSQLTKNGQILDHHQVNNHNSQCKNNLQTENSQELTHHHVNNHNLENTNNELTENAQIPEHHQVLNQIPPFANIQINVLLTTIIDDAISLKQYQRSFHTRHRGLSSKYKPDIRVNVKYLSDAVTLPASGLVALSSDMGSGKTEIMRLLREAYPHIKFLNIGHRVNLLKNLATRLKTEMYSDLTYAGLVKAQALSITIDSLHKLHTQMLNYGCIFIDEACQFLTHLLHSKTCKEYRAEILEVLQYIVYNAPLVIIADAHLDDITVDFFRALRPPGEKPFIVKNDWRNGDRLIYWYEGKNSSAIVAQISAALMNKQKIMVASDSKRFIKKLEQSLTVKVRVEEAGSRGAGEQGSKGAKKQNPSQAVKDVSSQISQINSTSSEGINNTNSQISQVNSTSFEIVKDGISPTLSQVNSASSEGINNSNSQISPVNSTSSQTFKDGNSQISPVNSTSSQTFKDGNSQISPINSNPSETINNSNSQILPINSTSFEIVKDSNSPTLSQGDSTSSETVKACNEQTLSQVNSALSEAIDNSNSQVSQVNSTSTETDKNENSQISQINSTSSNHIPTPNTSHPIPETSHPTPNTQHHSDQDHESPRPKLRLWSIHSDNSGSEENVAFIKDITNAVKDVDALLYSPSLGTGVDINEYHFDLVFGIFHAKSQTATECAQQLYRYRPNVPIHVWVAPRPPFGYQETNALKIKERMLQTNEVTAFVLRIDRETGRRGVEKDWALDAYCKILAARNRSINNLRDDLHDLLTEMGNKIISMGGDEDTFTQEQMKKAAAALDTAYYSAVTRAKNISATEYRQRQNKDYLKPEEIFECEKYRIQDAYGMEVTESLVEQDAGGQLSRSISALEAILKEPEGTIFDSHTNRQYPLPPTIVTDKDRQERENLPLCMDWGNYSAKWLARFNLGLHDILKRLVAGEEVTARDPELLNMVAIGKQYGVYIKTILGFNVPDKCQPMWLLGMLLDQLGLKLVDRKEGPRGKQVRVFSLSQVELDFALKVIEYRELKRNQKQERARKQEEEQRRYQARMQTLYGVAPPPDPVSTPPPNGIGNPLGEGVNTTADGVDFAAGSGDGNDSSLTKGADGVNFAAGSKDGNDSSLADGADQVDFSALQRNGEETSLVHSVERVDFRQFQPDDGDETPLVNCVEVLRASFNKGVEAIKSVLRSWSEDRRWGTVLLLEEIAANELRSLEQLMPQFYDWLSESVLPMNC